MSGAEIHSTATSETVALCLVTHGSGAEIEGWMEAVGELTYRPLELVIVDCAGGDDALDQARQLAPFVLPGVDAKLLPLEENLGWGGGMNAAIAATRAPWVLALNPDARPEPDFIERLLERAHQHPQASIAALTGRLLRPPEGAGDPRRLDACGMRLTPTWRHLDRGSSEPDEGQFNTPQRVFGATGAAALYNREALLDVAVDGDVFDPLFHMYREDAEICFRFQSRGWTVLYEPSARCTHGRVNLPELRQAMAPEINYHSLKNRYLIRAYHQSPGNWIKTLIPALFRDLAALVYVLLRERTSLPAYSWLWSQRDEILRRRRWIRRHRKAPDRELDRWFFRDALSIPEVQEALPERRDAPPEDRER
ncbi:MAG: glycosyltransferase [Acidobacteriota bacterium]